MCTNGKIQPHENVVEGFENMPKALIDQLDGKSQGKTMLRVWHDKKRHFKREKIFTAHNLSTA